MRLPLSFAQERLWFLEQLVPGTAVQNVPLAARLRGPLDVSLLRAALNIVIRRHEVLRTVFVTDGAEPEQRVLAELDLPIELADLGGTEPGERDTACADLLSRRAAEPFDLETGPLIRATLVRRGPDDHELLLVIHHIVADGWSVSVLLTELSAICAALHAGGTDPLPPLPIQYADFALWQRERLAQGGYERDLAYWKERLGATLPVLELPMARTGTPGEFTGRLLTRELSPELTQALERTSRQEHCSLFMTLLAAYVTLLHRHSGESSLVVGTPIANRNNLEIEELIGFFVNTLALRFDVDARHTFRDLLKQVRKVAIGGFAHQDLPFEKLVEELRPERRVSQAPLFQVMFVLQNAPKQPFELPGLEISPVDVHNGTAKFDLLLSVCVRDGRLFTTFEYDAAKFDEDVVGRMLDRYRTLLESIVEDPGAGLTALPMLPADERAELLWIGRAREGFPADSCLHELFAVRAARTPDAVAVTFQDERLTYAELDGRAEDLAARLHAAGVRNGSRVGLFLERSLDTVVAIVGVLKAGGAYVPMDAAYPTSRLRAIVEDSRPEVLLTQRRMLDRLPAYPGTLICLDEPAPRAEAPAFPEPADPDSGAYVIYTSGSTGRPKGVLVSHRNVVRLFESTQRMFGFDETDVWTMFHSYAFDFSVWELWGALLYGGRVVVVPTDVARAPETYFELVRAEGVTVLNQTPSAFVHFAAADAQRPGAGLALRHVVFGGEALELGSLRQWIARHGDRSPRLINMYGITETTVHVTYRPIVAADLEQTGRSPIGEPLPDLELYVLDERLCPVPFGVTGELYVGGAGLAAGYLGALDLTARRFVPHPFATGDGARLYRSGDLARVTSSGDIEYLGRADHQVKIRGYRIEAGEIEAGLLAHPGVSAAVVTPHTAADGDRKLVAYVVADPAALTDDDEDSSDAGDASQDQVGEWELVFDGMYGSTREGLAEDFVITGWNSSYSNEPIPAEEMAEWVTGTVDGIRALAPKRVLEIGCGTGLLLQRLAPHADDYYGTDLSGGALASLGRRLTSDNVTLLHQAADRTDGLPARYFDTVVLNSVAQYFPDAHYLTDVLVGTAATVARPATMFVGDIRDLRLLEAFHLSIELFRAEDSMPLSRLRQQISRRMQEEDELLCDPLYFHALRGLIPDLAGVEILLKRGRHRNEMSCFRYDVLLHLGERPERGPGTRLDWTEDGLSIARLGELLAAGTAGTLTVRGIANPRVATELRALAFLRDAPPEATVVDLRRELEWADLEDRGVEIEDLHDLAGRHGYELRAEWNADLPGGYDAVLIPTGSPRTTTTSAAHGPAGLAEPHHYANDPLRARRRRNLVPRVRAFLKDRVPHYMVPAAFVVLDELPLTPNGKVDRQALPHPDAERAVQHNAYVAPRTDTERAVTELCAATLGIERVGVEDNFFELGGHSLLATQLVFRLRDELGVELPLRVLFDSPTMAGIAAAVDGTAPGSPDADLAAEVGLAEDIRPAAEVVTVAADPATVLLTGATGFLGAFVLRELLRRTRAEVLCLVRGRDEEDAAERLRGSLARYGIWNEEEMAGRVTVLAGDLAAPRLGLTGERFDVLSRTVDAVYHSGASVNLVYPYSELKAANVTGTEEVLRLAAAHRTVPVHYVSTIGVFGAPPADGVAIREDDATGPAAGLGTGYTRSKWVAEENVRIARERGLPVSVYRPSRIAGDSETGACQSDDFLWRVLKGCVQAEAAPAGAEMLVDLVPVDYVSSAIVALSQGEDAGGSHHLTNSGDRVRLSVVLEYLRSFGYTLRELPFPSWGAAVAADPDNAAYPLLGVLGDAPAGGLGDLVFDASRTERGLAGTGVALPDIDRELFATYVAYFVRSGFLPPPTGTSAGVGTDIKGVTR
ncbi:non-ribosomal peptide synthetase [Streptosporangium lutulentum]|uniref:Amino acid adenylation domain-containing protein/thioester reductase-like protein n=1 Tax=Streptosporangium lutulentum TaxID=1461250 RepID=A0ABT9Q4R2_9ACTN|nr:non-ribosomal peptide synthetase [Streptosporangium lutulentum]MDP9841725.1 amino acid adenylation domain-containing protein/thioester reductase-like protein [Streptosporangium lutulentum]